MAEKSLCAVAGCDKPVHGLTYCTSHLRRFRKHGDPSGGGTERGAPLLWLRDRIGYDGTECLIWPFSRHPTGYGQVSFRGQPMGAHRAMCILAHGEPPNRLAEAAHVCGKGDEGCCNPRHIRWSSRTQNEADKMDHGSRPVGERSHLAKLSDDDAREIRGLAGTMLHREIAERYGVTRMTVTDIINRRSWRWME